MYYIESNLINFNFDGYLSKLPLYILLTSYKKVTLRYHYVKLDITHPPFNGTKMGNVTLTNHVMH